MAILTQAQAIEAFHLAFLQVLQTRLDPALYVLKGGANLRYFFESHRYSQDIDLDLVGAEPWIVNKKVDEIFESKPLELLLRPSGIELEERKGKQTGTTLRWKWGLIVPGHPGPLPTKVEFSNRNGEDRLVLEAVPRRIVEPYALQPPKVQHYKADAATEQKVVTLANRSETQARDVFDLDLLFRQQPFDPASVAAQTRSLAAQQAMSLPFDAFRDQVLPFLEPEIAQMYDADAWERMQLFVADKLEDT